MRVGLQSWGTEGDLRPFLGLGRALIERGHDVRLVFTGVEGRDFADVARRMGMAARAAALADAISKDAGARARRGADRAGRVRRLVRNGTNA